MDKPVIVYGSRQLSTMLYHDSVDHPTFRIACFAADQPFLSGTGMFLGLPHVDFASINELYPPERYDLIAMVTGYDDMRNRYRMYQKAKAKGYRLRNYVSASCEIANDVAMGDNNLIFGQTHIGYGGRMGDCNTIRHQTYLGHEFELGDFNVITPDCRIGGNCAIGSNCYIGLGATVKNGLAIADDTLIGAGTVVLKDTEPASKNVGNPSRIIGYHKETGIQIKVHHG